MATIFHKEPAARSCQRGTSLHWPVVFDLPVWRTTGSQHCSRSDARSRRIQRRFWTDGPRHRTCLLLFLAGLRTVSCSSRLWMARRSVIWRRRQHTVSLVFWSRFSHSRARTLDVMNREWSNHALQRTWYGVVVCNSCVPSAGSLSFCR